MIKTCDTLLLKLILGALVVWVNLLSPTNLVLNVGDNNILVGAASSHVVTEQFGEVRLLVSTQVGILKGC